MPVRQKSFCAGKSKKKCVGPCRYASGKKRKYCRMAGKGIRAGTAGATKAQIYKVAKRLNIKGRSRMLKSELIRAVQDDYMIRAHGY